MALPAHVNFIAYLYTTRLFRKTAKQSAMKRMLPPLSFFSLCPCIKALLKSSDSYLKYIDLSFSVRFGHTNKFGQPKLGNALEKWQSYR